VQVLLRQVGGEYLPWRNVMAKEPEHYYQVDPKELTRALRLVQLASSFDRITAVFGDGAMVLTGGEGGQRCREDIPCSYQGEFRKFLLGAQYLLDGLAGCGDTAEVAFTEAPAPLFLRSGQYKYSLQPRREL